MDAYESQVILLNNVSLILLLECFCLHLSAAQTLNVGSILDTEKQGIRKLNAIMEKIKHKVKNNKSMFIIADIFSKN